MTAAWIHASARRWGETWIPYVSKIPSFYMPSGVGKNPWEGGGPRACALRPKGGGVWSQVSYGKGPDNYLLKTAIFPVSVFLLIFSMKFGNELENYQYDSFK